MEDNTENFGSTFNHFGHRDFCFVGSGQYSVSILCVMTSAHAQYFLDVTERPSDLVALCCVADSGLFVLSQIPRMQVECTGLPGFVS